MKKICAYLVLATVLSASQANAGTFATVICSWANSEADAVDELNRLLNAPGGAKNVNTKDQTKTIYSIKLDRIRQISAVTIIQSNKLNYDFEACVSVIADAAQDYKYPGP